MKGALLDNPTANEIVYSKSLSLIRRQVTTGISDAIQCSFIAMKENCVAVYRNAKKINMMLIDIHFMHGRYVKMTSYAIAMFNYYKPMLFITL